MENLNASFKKSGIKFTENQPLASKSTFKVGSTADFFTAPETPEQFKTVLNLVKSSGIEFYTLGGGSNTVFPDTPYKGVIISTEKLNKITIKQAENNKVYVTCEAGTPMSAFIKTCIENNISGIEQFAGLPGSVGGAVYMNARCFNKSINEIFYSAEYISADSQNLELNHLEYDESQWDYKKSPFQPKEGSGAATKPHNYVLTATFLLNQINQDDKSGQKKLAEDCKHYISERKDKGHFKFPSAGSVFKNNHEFGKPSGQIIDEAGLRGLTIGGAQVAPFHGNFIININHATQSDIKSLVLKVQDTVKAKFGFKLEPEIIFLQ